MDRLESNLSLQPGDLLNDDARINAKSFLASNFELKITSSEFKTLLLQLATSSPAAEQLVSELVPTRINEKDTLSKKSNQRWPARLSVASTERRSISLGGFSSRKKSFLDGPNDSFPISRREKLIHEHESLLRHYEEATLFLDNQRSGMLAKLYIYETQLQELMDNDHKRLHDIEAIEQELEATQNELHERRIRQTEELQRAKETAAILEAELATNYEENGREVETSELQSSLNLIEPTEGGDDYTNSGDIYIRLHRLEEEKRSYKDLIVIMEKERTGLLTMVEHLKEQLNELQSEIVSLKAYDTNKNLLINQHNPGSDICESNGSLFFRIGFITGAVGLCLAGVAVLSGSPEKGLSIIANCDHALQSMATSFQGWFQDQDL